MSETKYKLSNMEECQLKHILRIIHFTLCCFQVYNGARIHKHGAKGGCVVSGNISAEYR